MSLKQSLMAFIMTVVAGSGTLATAAPFTDNFTDIIAELQLRAAGLSNSVDKVGQSQYKAVVKAQATLGKVSTSLDTDLKTAGSLAKSLLKAFPSDFASFAAVPLIPSTPFGTLFANLLTDFQNDVQDAMNELQATINGLPAGSAKDKATAALTQAQALFVQVNAGAGYANAFKALGSVLKSVAKGQKAAASGGGGGGGNGDGTLEADIIIAGVTNHFAANNGQQIEYQVGAGLIDINGSNTNTVDSMSIPVTNNFTGVGTYALVNGVGGYFAPGFVLYSITSGSLSVTNFSTNAPIAEGTFWFNASDGTTNIVVTNGTFSITNVIVTP